MNTALTTFDGHRYAAEQIAGAMEAEPGRQLFQVESVANRVAPLLGLQPNFLTAVREERSDVHVLVYRLNPSEAVEVTDTRADRQTMLAKRLAVLTSGRRRGPWWMNEEVGIMILATRASSNGATVACRTWPPRRRRRGPTPRRGQLQLVGTCARG